MSIYISLILHKTQAPEGYSLSVEIIADAIQGVSDDVVKDAWGVTAEDGRIKPSELLGN